MTNSEHEMDVLTDVARERARVEARELTAMLRFRDREVARTAALDSPRLVRCGGRLSHSRSARR